MKSAMFVAGLERPALAALGLTVDTTCFAGDTRQGIWLFSGLFYHGPFDYSWPVKNESSALGTWTPEQIALGKRWVETWKLAGADLERIRRKEIRELDTYQAIALLCGPADYTRPPRAPKPFSGLVEQQRWFMKAACRD